MDYLEFAINQQGFPNSNHLGITKRKKKCSAHWSLLKAGLNKNVMNEYINKRLNTSAISSSVSFGLLILTQPRKREREREGETIGTSFCSSFWLWHNERCGVLNHLLENVTTWKQAYVDSCPCEKVS